MCRLRKSPALERRRRSPLEHPTLSTKLPVKPFSRVPLNNIQKDSVRTVVDNKRTPTSKQQVQGNDRDNRTLSHMLCQCTVIDAMDCQKKKAALDKARKSKIPNKKVRIESGKTEVSKQNCSKQLKHTHTNEPKQPNMVQKHQHIVVIPFAACQLLCVTTTEASLTSVHSATKFGTKTCPANMSYSAQAPMKGNHVTTQARHRID